MEGGGERKHKEKKEEKRKQKRGKEIAKKGWT